MGLPTALCADCSPSNEDGCAQCNAAGAGRPVACSTSVVPEHIADSGCNRTCLGTKVGMENFVRKDVRISLGDNGRSYMMARGYGDLGVFKRALFVPGLTKDLISTVQFDLEGRHESTGGGVKRIWKEGIGKSEVLLEFQLSAEDLFYHLVNPPPAMSAPRKIQVGPAESALQSAAKISDVTAPLAKSGSRQLSGTDVDEDCEPVTVGANDEPVADRDPDNDSCSDSKMKLRKKIRQLVGKRAGEPTDGKEDDPVLSRLVRKEVRRMIRGSRGVTVADGSVGLNALQKLHLRLGHASRDQLLRLLKSGAAKGLGTTYEECKDLPLGICDACLRGKSDAMHIPSSESATETTSAPFTDLHMDIKEMTCESKQKNHCTTWIIDRGTGKHYAYHLQGKSDQDAVIRRFVLEEVIPSGHGAVKNLTADCDSTFLEQRFIDTCLQIGIRLRTSPPHVHQANGVVERAIGADLKMMRAVMARYNSPKSYWQYALDYVIHTRNRLVDTVGSDNISPEQRSTGEVPDLSIARPFDAPCWYHVHKEERSGKGAVFKSRVEHGRMVGYSTIAKGSYLVINRNGRELTRPQVYCKEYPGRLGLENLSEHSDPISSEGKVVGGEVSHSKRLAGDPELAIRGDAQPVDRHVPSAADDEDYWHKSDIIERRETRLMKARRLRPQKVTAQARFAEVNSSIQAFLALDGFRLPKTPKTMEEALTGPDAEHWAKAREKELGGIEERKTWCIEEPPKGKRPITSKWAFRTSWEPDGTVKYRARIVARGFSQVPGTDFDDTYAPTLQFKTLLCLLGMIAHLDMEAEATDVGSAYLESKIDKVIFMVLPKDLWENGERRTVRLLKALYGLKQAGELWHKLMGTHLQLDGFTRTASDACLWTKTLPCGGKVYIMIYVDDIVIASGEQGAVDAVKAMLDKRFKMKHQGEIVRFLGMEISRDRENRLITVGQSVYARSVVDEFLGAGAKPSNIPGVPSLKLRLAPKGSEDPMHDVVGKLRFLADRTRPDILTAVNALGTGAAQPGPEHVRAAKRVLRYLKGTTESAIVLGGKCSMVPLAFCDASYTADGDSKSQFGYSVHLHNSGASIIRSKTGTTVPHSPCEAEVKAMDEVVREIIWLRILLEELGFPQLEPTLVYSDSTAGIDQISAFKNSSKARHYTRDLNFLREAREGGIVRFEHVGSDNNRSDMLTKDLGYDKFSRFARAVMRGELL
jgi:hypothetical protein